MSRLTEARWPLLAWVAPGLLAALVMTNAVFLALLQTGGPLIGLVLYAVLLWRWRRRDYRATVVGGLAGLVVHVVEVVMTGWSDYPALMALNLILPTLLAPIAWLVSRQVRQEDSSQQRAVEGKRNEGKPR